MVVLINFTSTINSQPCYYKWWDSTYTGSGAAQDSAIALALDNTGSFLYVTGWSISGTYANIVTIKYNAVTGNRIWTSIYDFAGFHDRPTAIAVNQTTGEVYVTGYSYVSLPSNRDFVTIKYNAATGDTLWTRRYNGPVNGGDESYAIGIDNSGNIFVTGNSDQGGAMADIVTIKYTPAGAQTVNLLALPNFQKPNALKINSSGDVFVAGVSRTNGNLSVNDDYITIKYNNSLAVQWSKVYNGTANNQDDATGVVTDGSGNAYVTGFSYWTGQFYNYVTIKYNSNGDSVNAASYNGPLSQSDYATSIGIDGTGNIYVTGYSVGAVTPSVVNDYATLQYNSSLQQQWVNRYNGAGNGDDRATSLAVDVGNNVYVTGYSLDSSSVYDFLTIKYTSAGSPLCTLSQNTASNMNAYATAIVVDALQVFYVTGGANVPGSGLDFLTIRNSRFPIGVEPISSEIPNKFELYQNYPNPFNPATKIRFDLPSASIVKLAVYDVSGKELSIMAEEFLRPGEYSFQWDASGYSSGIYFCRLTADNFSQTRKMVLIK